MPLGRQPIIRTLVWFGLSLPSLGGKYAPYSNSWSSTPAEAWSPSRMLPFSFVGSEQQRAIQLPHRMASLA